MNPKDSQSLGQVVELPLVSVGAKVAARLVGVSERSWRRLNVSGLVPAPIKLNTSVRWCVEELQEWARSGSPSRARWAEMRGKA